MSIENKSETRPRRPICSLRTFVIFIAVLLCAGLLSVIIYYVVSYTKIRDEFGTLTCTVTKTNNGYSFYEDRHHMLCEIENQIVDAPNISIASTGEDYLVNEFGLWKQTNVFFLPDRIGERFPNLLSLGSGYTKVRSLFRSNFVGFRKLKLLAITNSDLVEIEQGAFDPMDSLVTMALSDNKIKEMDCSWFENKKFLVWLTLDSNEIEFIPHGCFDKLPSLETVLFSYNQIKSITSPLFLNNNMLHTFHLIMNPLEFISDTAFDGNFNQLTVALYSNTTTCFQDHITTFTIPPANWKNIVRERCNGTNALSFWNE